MAGEPNNPDAGGNPPPNDGAAPPAFERHAAIPETFVKDGAYDFDGIGATLTEANTLKTAAAERAALIPANPDDYKFDLPEGFELPEGRRWSADPNDPVVSGFRTLATELKLTQPEVQKLVAFEAKRQAEEIKAQAAFDAEQTKALGANAEQRRSAARDWLKTVTNPEQAKLLETVLGYALGVEALESIIDKSKHVTRGNGGDGGKDDKNVALAEKIGQPGTSAMDIFNAAQG